MSDSYKRTPVYKGYSSKEGKTLANRVLRRKIRQWASCSDTEAVAAPLLYEVSNRWCWPSEYRWTHFGHDGNCYNYACWADGYRGRQMFFNK